MCVCTCLAGGSEKGPQEGVSRTQCRVGGRRHLGWGSRLPGKTPSGVAGGEPRREQCTGKAGKESRPCMPWQVRILSWDKRNNWGCLNWNWVLEEPLLRLDWRQGRPLALGWCGYPGVRRWCVRGCTSLDQEQHSQLPQIILSRTSPGAALRGGSMYVQWQGHICPIHQSRPDCLSLSPGPLWPSGILSF